MHVIKDTSEFGGMYDRREVAWFKPLPPGETVEVGPVGRTTFGEERVGYVGAEIVGRIISTFEEPKRERLRWNECGRG